MHCPCLLVSIMVGRQDLLFVCYIEAVGSQLMKISSRKLNLVQLKVSIRILSYHAEQFLVCEEVLLRLSILGTAAYSTGYPTCVVWFFQINGIQMLLNFLERIS